MESLRRIVGLWGEIAIDNGHLVQCRIDIGQREVIVGQRGRKLSTDVQTPTDILQESRYVRRLVILNDGPLPR
jgi:hypothetical protein